MLCVIHSEKKT